MEVSLVLQIFEIISFQIIKTKYVLEFTNGQTVPQNNIQNYDCKIKTVTFYQLVHLCLLFTRPAAKSSSLIHRPHCSASVCSPSAPQLCSSGLKSVRFGCSSWDFSFYFLRLVLFTLFCTASNLPGSLLCSDLWPVQSYLLIIHVLVYCLFLYQSYLATSGSCHISLHMKKHVNNKNVDCGILHWFLWKSNWHPWWCSAFFFFSLFIPHTPKFTAW